MDSYEPYPSLALALVAGMLVGLEREHSRPAPDSGRGFVGGIRTYPLIALVGAVATLLAKQLGPWPLVVAGVGLGALLVMTWHRDAGAGHLGFTTEASAMLTFLLGALALSSGVVEPLSKRIFVVSAIAVTATVLLSSKTQLREFSSRLSRDDVIATLKFLIVAVVVLPVLPNEAHGPYGALNPFRIGVMVVLIAGIGFVGYVAMRLWGAGRGLLVTAAIGGLVSSTAVTLASAARARKSPALAGLSGLAVIVASSIMLVRVLAAVFALERTLFLALLPPLGAMALISTLVCGFFAWREHASNGHGEQVELTNPFELSSSLKFASFFVVILLASRWAGDTFGANGSYVTGALAGLTDVDAITLSMTNMLKTGQVDVVVAQRTIVLAIMSNTVVKGILAFTLGGAVMGRRVAFTYAATLAGGIAASLFLEA